MIGETLEDLIQQPLQQVADENKLYLDFKHARPARGGKRKVTWQDENGNDHDLDYVLEVGGSEQQIGQPKAFIEVAWRRYTKHSRNKAQEIQGALAPLARKYNDYHPFLGAVIAGVFTQGSLIQLTSLGFTLLYYPYDSVIDAFGQFGIDASYDEKTQDAELLRRVRAYEALGPAGRKKIATSLRELHGEDLKDFLQALAVTLNRAIEAIQITPLHGSPTKLSSLKDALDFVDGYQESAVAHRFTKYEIRVRFTNGDEINGSFREKAGAIGFLHRVSA